MSLHIQHISLHGFRGYDSFELPIGEHLVIIEGDNAVGKTNIVEAIQLLTSGDSFRKPGWAELPTWGSASAHIELLLADGKRSIEHAMTIDDGKRSFFVNGKKKPASSLRGFCPSVLFIPDDLQMVKASSAKRRDSVDAVATQLSAHYASLRKEYAQALRQRNTLLREDMATGALFESWNDSLVVHGSRLFTNRYRLFERLRAHMAAIYSDIVPGERFDAVYIPSWKRFDEQGRQIPDIMHLEDVDMPQDVGIEGAQDAMWDALERLRPNELQRRTSLVGPHKDEIAFFIEGRNARLFASQGQQRTIVLVFKLAEVELMREMLDGDPILLLDDVMSELDARHREALTSFIEASSQTFITTTNLGYFTEQLLDQAQVVKLPVGREDAWTG